MANNKVRELISKGKTLQALEELGDAGLLHRFKDMQKKASLGLIGFQTESELLNNIVYEALKKVGE